MANKKKEATALVTTARIAQRIMVIRGQKVMIDADLAELYGTQTRTLNQAVRRNQDRFPEDFVFQLTKAEKQEVITNCDHLARLRFSPALPYAFTEHGALMAASVLNTPLAVEVSVYVVRAFVRLREMIAANKEFAKKFEELERRLDTHDQAITEIMHAIRQLMTPPEKKKWPIGFVVPEENKPTKPGSKRGG